MKIVVMPQLYLNDDGQLVMEGGSFEDTGEFIKLDELFGEVLLAAALGATPEESQ